MKQVKSFCILVVALVAIVTHSHAQTRQVTGLAVTQGNTLQYGGVGGVASDSLQSTDTIAYLISASHTNAVDPFLQWAWNKIGSGNPTVTMQFFQSNDNINWIAIPKGAAQSAYTKTFSPTATTVYNVSFAADSARFEGRYMKVEYITSTTASTKGKLYGYLKFNIR